MAAGALLDHVGLARVQRGSIPVVVRSPRERVVTGVTDGRRAAGPDGQREERSEREANPHSGVPPDIASQRALRDPCRSSVGSFTRNFPKGGGSRSH
ncbi:hypothetical protein DB32_004364 [Sandaracinus amylolyticus]|uniref:Uncharacterized protein n=1 Tax=Sandaracinus amylolyticus TaxID=927083 RepID=A0A0F6W4M6_9BACT|nr:hypothetical protein DB32_004364 [Sandaracinus amylolyticus]